MITNIIANIFMAIVGLVYLATFILICVLIYNMIKDK